MSNVIILLLLFLISKLRYSIDLYASLQIEKKHRDFVLVYIDDVLVFSKNREEHVSHLKIVLAEFLNHGIIISKNKAKFFKKNIEFLGTEIGQGKIKLQPHISKKILEFPDKIEETKKLQQFLGLQTYYNL